MEARHKVAALPHLWPAHPRTDRMSKCWLLMPAKAMQVNTENIDYTQRVE
jgi:hypothetical protein